MAEGKEGMGRPETVRMKCDTKATPVWARTTWPARPGVGGAVPLRRPRLLGQVHLCVSLPTSKRISSLRSRPFETPTGEAGVCSGTRSAPASLSSSSSCSSASSSALSSSWNQPTRQTRSAVTHLVDHVAHSDRVRNGIRYLVCKVHLFPDAVHCLVDLFDFAETST